MRKLRCSIILAVALAMLVPKCFGETAEQISARNELGEYFSIYGDFRMTYYIHSGIAHETTWIEEVEKAARLITDNTCVTVERSYSASASDVIIRGGRDYYKIEDELPCARWRPHPSMQKAIFRLDLQDKWDVLRIFLLCLAPFKDEFLRKDRDEEVSIYWSNIRYGKHSRFIKRDDYPPDLPGFPGYCHGCVVNPPFTYLSKDGNWTFYPKHYGYLYYYKRWRVDLQRLRLYYRQLEIEHTRVVEGWFYNSEEKYYAPKPGCATDLEGWYH